LYREDGHPFGAVFEHLLFGLQLSDFLVKVGSRSFNQDGDVLWSWHWKLA
jgi:hypothetical protein